MAIFYRQENGPVQSVVFLSFAVCIIAMHRVIQLYLILVFDKSIIQLNWRSNII